MDQLSRQPDPATLKFAGRSVSMAPRANRFRFVRLSAEQAGKLGPSFPTMRSFLPLATLLQLAELVDAVPLHWTRQELGSRRGEVSLLAIVNPSDQQIAPPVAARRKEMIRREIERRLPSPAAKLLLIKSNVSPDEWRRIERKVAKFCDGITA